MVRRDTSSSLASRAPLTGRRCRRRVWIRSSSLSARAMPAFPGLPGERRQYAGYVVLNRRAFQRGIDHLRQGFELERLLQRRPVAIFFRKARRAVAGCEDERAVASLDQFGDRGEHLAVDVDVQNGEVELGGL